MKETLNIDARRTTCEGVQVPPALLRKFSELGSEGIGLALLIMSIAPQGGQVALSTSTMKKHGHGRQRGRALKRKLCSVLPQAFIFKPGGSGQRGSDVIVYEPKGLNNNRLSQGAEQ